MKSLDIPCIALDRNYIQSPLNANFLRAGNGASVHEPDNLCAFEVAPEDVGFPVPIEVTRTDDGPEIRNIGDRAIVNDAAPIHQPHGHTPCGVTPEDIRLPIAVKVPDSRNRHVRWPGADVCETEHRTAIH